MQIEIVNTVLRKAPKHSHSSSHPWHHQLLRYQKQLLKNSLDIAPSCFLILGQEIEKVKDTTFQQHKTADKNSAILKRVLDHSIAGLLSFYQRTASVGINTRATWFWDVGTWSDSGWRRAETQVQMFKLKNSAKWLPVFTQMAADFGSCLHKLALSKQELLL